MAKDIRTRRFLFSRATVMVRCAIFTGGHPWLADDIKERGIDELNPIWNVLDLTPQGRGKFYASLEYGTKIQAVQAARG